ncbi:hypothetical protein DPMN_140219 [Dreissena polymorpha]|uniref:TNF family profile domain-containing protein n=2 Tax=Dreissena polymorpha TaxID=45954 RepID=A0A9D4JIU3_DREPO|nr:hypothetical protein DPMN_140219 [Dreissena polymorpha]
MLQTSDVTVPDDENNHGRPIIQLQSRDLEGRFVRWHAENGDQTFRRPGLRLLDDRKIKFEKDGYFFVSTKLAFNASDQGIIRAQFTVMVKEETDKYFKPFCEQNETLSNQYGGRYVSDCNFVHHFTSGSLIYVQLDHVEGMQKNDGKIMIFYLGL